MLRTIIKISFYTIVVLNFSSCIGELEYDRTEDLLYKPSIIMPLVHDTIRSNDLALLDFIDTIKVSLDLGIENNYISDLELAFNIRNSYPEDFSFLITFKDLNYNELYSIDLNNILARDCNVIHNDRLEKRKIMISGEDLSNIFSTNFIIIDIRRTKILNCNSNDIDYIYLALGIKAYTDNQNNVSYE